MDQKFVEPKKNFSPNLFGLTLALSNTLVAAYIDMSCTCTDTATLTFTLGNTAINQFNVKVRITGRFVYNGSDCMR